MGFLKMTSNFFLLLLQQINKKTKTKCFQLHFGDAQVSVILFVMSFSLFHTDIRECKSHLIRLPLFSSFINLENAVVQSPVSSLYMEVKLVCL